MPDILIGKCRQDGCKIGESGKCLEGFEEPDKCPHFIPPEPGKPEEEIPSSEETSEKQAEEPGTIELPDGADLNPDSAKHITRSAVTRLIILAGAPESGKTTLLATIYECFQWGSFAGYLFAGSQTLPGFERRCHLSRIASDRVKPDTERTKPGPGQTFLHLRVRDEKLNRSAQDILLSDISGEIFKLAKDSTDEVLKLGAIKRADHFVLLLDGEKLSQIDRRHEAFNDGALLLRSCLDADMLGKKSFTEVLFTKWDLIENNPSKDKIIEFIDDIKKQMKENFEQRLGRLRFFSIAARPEKPVLEFGYGLKEIFSSWVEDYVEVRNKRGSSRYDFDSESEFDRYSSRRLTNQEQ